MTTLLTGIGIFGLSALSLLGVTLLVCRSVVNQVKDAMPMVFRGRTFGEVLDSYPYQRNVEWVKTGTWTAEFRCELLSPEERKDIEGVFLCFRFRVGITGSVRLVEAHLRMELPDSESPEKILDPLELLLILNRFCDEKPLFFER